MNKSDLIIDGFYYESLYYDNDCEKRIIKADKADMDDMIDFLHDPHLSYYVYAPIPFTKKIMEKLEEQGFNKTSNNGWLFTYNYKGLQFHWREKIEMLRFDTSSRIFYIKYVHHLQMLLRAFGIEDEFEL